MKILIIQQKMIGDVLTSSVLFEALKKEYNNASLYYLINSNTFSAVEQNPFIDQVIIYPKQAEQSAKGLIEFSKKLKKEKFDILIDVYSKLSSNVITIYSGAKTKISYNKWYTKWIYTKTLERNKEANQKTALALEHRLQLLTPILKTIPEDLKPKIYLTEQEKEKGKSLIQSKGLQLNKPIIMISVLGSSASKSYPLKYMSQVIDTVAQHSNAQILFNYLPSQVKEAHLIFDYCNDKTKKSIFLNVYKQNLRAFLCILYNCQAIVGNEGGAINMAKALNIKTFSIFSPWIDKATWSIFEDQTTNISVHLKDYHPKLYNKKTKKNIKKDNLTLYKLFTPHYFKPALLEFLKPF